MRATLLMTVLVSTCSTGWADDSCAIRAAKLLAGGKVAELSAWFKTPATTTEVELKQAADLLGSLDRITPAKGQRAGAVARRSILSSGLPAQYPFDGSWADAVSANLGPVQIQASAETGTTCRLLALHIDTPNR